MTMFKRDYWKDLAFLADILEKGYGYTKAIAEKMGRTIRSTNYTLHKLEDLGHLERVGKARCHLQWYRIPHNKEVAVARLVEYLTELFRDGKRTYFTIEFINATLPCRGCTLPRWRGRPLRTEVSVVEEPYYAEFWIPFEISPYVFDIFDDLEIPFDLEVFDIDLLIPEDSFEND